LIGGSDAGTGPDIAMNVTGMNVTGMNVNALAIVVVGVVLSGRARRAVRVCVVVAAVRRGWHLMTEPQRAVEHERERRHDRKRGGETPELRMDRANHPNTEFMLRTN
jgi:hypothetical protein